MATEIILKQNEDYLILGNISITEEYIYATRGSYPLRYKVMTKGFVNHGRLTYGFTSLFPGIDIRDDYVTYFQGATMRESIEKVLKEGYQVFRFETVEEFSKWVMEDK
jgi:L-fucose isomerase-like protein